VLLRGTLSAGYVEMTIKTTCDDCKGTGKVIYPQTGEKIRCPSCGGLGYKVSQDSRGSR
jgi:DnaJ-class molecular chaperone